jgi:putative oxidoreductase
MPFLNRFSDHLYSLMRLMVGFLFPCHGAQKLFGVLGGPAMRQVPLMFRLR